MTGTIRNFMVRGKALEALDHVFDEMHTLLSPITLDGAAAVTPPAGGG